MTRNRERLALISKFSDASAAALHLAPSSFRSSCLSTLRYRRGLLARYARFILLRSSAIACGDVVDVREGVYLHACENLVLGSYISINPMCYIDATGGVSIGDDVSIAHGVTIMSTEHVFASLETPIREQGVTAARTIIGSNVWIGAGARILAGVNIGQGSVIAAGAVVTKDVPSGTVAGGVPARVLKARGN